MPTIPLERTDRLAPLAGQVGRYAIVRRLAVGGMAEVYLARVTGPHGFARSVVLKRVRSDLARAGQIRRMFADEARVAAHLLHVNIAQVIDVGEVEGEPFLVMEYVEGRDVHALLAGIGARGLPIDIAVAIAMGVAAGLDHAHGRRDADGRPLGIVHRDVSPSNVMVGFDGNVKLLDFGVAKAQGARDVTRAGIVKGKAEYMSPEQSLGLAVDRRSDLFSLGTLLHEMLVGARPFDDGPTLMAPGRRRAGIPAALDALVMRLLAHEPAQRPASAEEVSIALDAIAREERLSCSPVALRRYLIERFGEPEAVAECGEAIADLEPETASLSIPPTTAVTAVDQLTVETTVARAQPRGRRALFLALAAAGALAMLPPVLAADGETEPAVRPVATAPAAPPIEVEVPRSSRETEIRSNRWAPAPVPPARKVSSRASEPTMPDDPVGPIPVAVPIEVERSTPEPTTPRPAVKRRRAPAARPTPAPDPASWDPDSPLLRSQQRRRRP